MTSWLAAAWLGIAPSAAQPAAVGLFVGSNRPGPGQQPLQFAVRDAQSVQAVLQEIGGLAPADATMLVDPDASEVIEALEAQRERLLDRHDRGEQSVFVFYYSGHARSQALSLGPSELPLPELRALLESMPSTVTVAVLDACQSGAISGVKGVQPAEGFSYNSAQVLHASGLALLASSTGAELSQESAELGASFFTHHLVTGLRGPADRDGDGDVSLDEAYHYAYHRTLVTTAPTRVGGQHVTLETRLRGHGDMVLTRPSDATAWLVLDGEVAGRVLVVREETVVAEVVTERGASVTLALPPGRYAVLGRDDVGPYRCDVDLRPDERTVLTEADCDWIEDRGTPTVKSAGYRAEALGIEAAAGLLRSWNTGAWLDTLGTFGFYGPVGLSNLSGMGALSFTSRLAGRTSLVLTGSNLEYRALQRDFLTDGELDSLAPDEYRWSAFRLGLYPRYSSPLHRDRLIATVQAGGGVSWSESRLGTASVRTSEGHTGYHLAAAAALHFVVRTPGVDFGPFLQAEWLYAPTLRNRLGEIRDVGGVDLQLGLRVSP